MAGRDQPAPSRADAAEPLTGGEAASVPGSVWLSNLCGPRQNADPKGPKRARSAVTPAPVSKIKNRMWRQYGPGRLLHHCALCCAQALRRGRWHCSMIVVRPSRADLPQPLGCCHAPSNDHGAIPTPSPCSPQQVTAKLRIGRGWAGPTGTESGRCRRTSNGRGGCHSAWQRMAVKPMWA